jgi:hypothetical protein
VTARQLAFCAARRGPRHAVLPGRCPPETATFCIVTWPRHERAVLTGCRRRTGPSTMLARRSRMTTGWDRPDRPDGDVANAGAEWRCVGGGTRRSGAHLDGGAARPAGLWAVPGPRPVRSQGKRPGRVHPRRCCLGAGQGPGVLEICPALSDHRTCLRDLGYRVRPGQNVEHLAVSSRTFRTYRENAGALPCRETGELTIASQVSNSVHPANCLERQEDLVGSSNEHHAMGKHAESGDGGHNAGPMASVFDGCARCNASYRLVLHTANTSPSARSHPRRLHTHWSASTRRRS